MSETDNNYLQILPKVDALIVLGRNFQAGYTKKNLIQEPFYLSPQSRINALAAGELLTAGWAQKLVLVGGHTAGSNVPTEADGLKSYIKHNFANIPDSAYILEEESIETLGNATETKKVLQHYPELKTFGVVSDPSHLVRAVPFFKKVGINAEVFDSIAILLQRRPEDIGEYIRSDLYKKTIRQDKIVQRFQTFPLLSPLFSWVLSRIALYQRNPTVPNRYFNAS